LTSDVVRELAELAQAIDNLWGRLGCAAGDSVGLLLHGVEQIVQRDVDFDFLANRNLDDLVFVAG